MLDGVAPMVMMDDGHAPMVMGDSAAPMMAVVDGVAPRMHSVVPPMDFEEGEWREEGGRR